MDWLPLGGLGHHVGSVLASRRGQASTRTGRSGTSNAGWSYWRRPRCTATKGAGSLPPVRGCGSWAPPSGTGHGPGSAPTGLRLPARVHRHHFLIGLVPPLPRRVDVTGGSSGCSPCTCGCCSRSSTASRPTARARPRAACRGGRASRPARSPRYVAEGRSAWARPNFNGLGSLGEGDRVHVVVRAGERRPRLTGAGVDLDDLIRDLHAVSTRRSSPASRRFPAARRSIRAERERDPRDPPRRARSGRRADR